MNDRTESQFTKAIDAAALRAYQYVAPTLSQMKEAIEDVKTDVKEIKADQKLSREKAEAHGLDDVRIQTELLASAKSSHKRHDREEVERKDADAVIRGEIRDARGPGVKGWLSIIAAVAAGIASIVLAVKGTQTEKDKPAAHSKEGK